MGIQRLLSVLCSPKAHSAAGEVISTVSSKGDIEHAAALRKRCGERGRERGGGGGGGGEERGGEGGGGGGIDGGRERERVNVQCVCV